MLSGLALNKMKTMIKIIKLKEIRLDGDTQQRVEINEEILSEYSEAMKCGAKFPPITAFFDGVSYWLADGFHRFHAQVATGFVDTECEILEGTKRDAKLFSFGANRNHGLRLTNADKNKSVSVMLNDSEWSAWPDEKIAKQCGVSREFVNRLRNRLKVTSQGVIRSQISSESQEIRGAANSKNEQITENNAYFCAENAISVCDNNPQENGIKNHTIEAPKVDEEAAMRAEMLNDALDALRDENESLRNQLSASLFTGTDEERAEYLDRLNFLTSENKRLTMLNNGLTVSRDRAMRENVSLRKQGEYAAKRLKALDKAA